MLYKKIFFIISILTSTIISTASNQTNIRVVGDDKFVALKVMSLILKRPNSGHILATNMPYTKRLDLYIYGQEDINGTSCITKNLTPYNQTREVNSVFGSSQIHEVDQTIFQAINPNPNSETEIKIDLTRKVSTLIHVLRSGKIYWENNKLECEIFPSLSPIE